MLHKFSNPSDRSPNSMQIIVCQQIKSKNLEHAIIFNQLPTKLYIGWLEFNVPFQQKYGYITDEPTNL